MTGEDDLTVLARLPFGTREAWRRRLARELARERARTRVAYAIKLGRLPAPATLACAACGGPAAEYHHPHGYGRGHELDVTASCRPCHTRQHAALRAWARWRAGEAG